MKNNRYNSISNVTYNAEVLSWKTNELNYCVIYRVELDNSKENIVVLPKRDLIVHKLCIEMYFIKKSQKIDCPICKKKFIYFKGY
jgi:hypothetical protein